MKWLLPCLLAIVGFYFALLVYKAEPAQRWLLFRRGIVGFLVVGGLLYVGLMVLLMLMETTLIYHPTRYPGSWVEPQGLHVEDVWLTAEDGTRIHGWWCPVNQPRWVVLYCHGNAGNLSWRQAPVREWQEHVKASVLIFDYPGYGRSDGSPSEAGCYAASEAAYTWLVKDKQVSPEELVIYGKSLGGAVAVHLAVRRPHRALVLISAFTCIPDMAGDLFPYFPTRWMVRTQCDNLAKLRTHTGPLFVAHGSADDIVPFRHSEELYAAAGTPSELKRFYPIPDATHNESAVPKFYQEVAKFLAELPAK